VVIGQNSSVGRKAVVDDDSVVGALRHVDREGG
jgi:carbonic anhydrase/acetyltransferase-like protein (isoleucine patch superfamily)